SISPTEVLDGRRRALVVAIQYEDGQEWPRKGFSMRMVGPYADADDICELLVDQGYDRQDIQVMTDKPGTHADDMPTRDNITDALSELVAWARPGDHLFLYFAGHGTQIEDQDGDEDDGKDETIIPCDWATRFQHRDEGLIVDDLLRRNCINRLPAGSQLTAVFDVRLDSDQVSVWYLCSIRTVLSCRYYSRFTRNISQGAIHTITNPFQRTA
ncbi:Ca(2+)-dependent cysteine protease, partial [Ceratobasidium sp. 428]